MLDDLFFSGHLILVLFGHPLLLILLRVTDVIQILIGLFFLVDVILQLLHDVFIFATATSLSAWAARCLRGGDLSDAANIRTLLLGFDCVLEFDFVSLIENLSRRLLELLNWWWLSNVLLLFLLFRCWLL